MGALLQILSRLAPSGAEIEHQTNWYLDTADQLIAAEGCELALRLSDSASVNGRQVPGVLILKFQERGQNGVSIQQLAVCTLSNGVAQAILSGKTDPLRWLERYVLSGWEQGPDGRDILDQVRFLLRLTRGASFRPLAVLPKDRWLLDLPVALSEGTVSLPFDLDLFTDREGRRRLQAEVGYSGSNPFSAQAAVTYALEELGAAPRPTMVHKRVLASATGIEQLEWPSEPRRSVPELAYQHSTLGSPIITQRGFDRRLEHPLVAAGLFQVSRAFNGFSQDVEDDSADRVLKALIRYDQLRGFFDDSLPTALTAQQKTALRTLAHRFGGWSFLDPALVELVQPKVQLLSPQTLTPILRALMSRHSPAGAAEVTHMADQLAMDLYRTHAQRWDPYSQSPPRFSQSEVDIIVLDILGTQVIRTEHQSPRSPENQPIPLGFLVSNGTWIEDYRQIEQLAALKVAGWIRDQHIQAEIEEVLISWVRRRFSKLAAGAIKREARQSGVDEEALQQAHRRMVQSGMFDLIRRPVHMEQILAPPCYEFFRRLIVDDAGWPVALARELYYLRLVREAEPLRIRAQDALGLEPRFRDMEAADQLPEGGAQLLEGLYSTWRGLTRRYAAQISSAAEQLTHSDAGFEELAEIQKTLLQAGEPLRAALNQAGGRAIRQVQRVEPPFGRRTHFEWWALESKETDLSRLQLVTAMTRKLNEHYLYRLLEGPEAAALLLKNAASLMALHGLVFEASPNPPEGVGRIRRSTRDPRRASRQPRLSGSRALGVGGPSIL